jgi:predicted RNA methylase
MARLASEAKLAYYPTDPVTLKSVIDRFLVIPKNTHVLDPCCGTGEAVAVFRDYGSILYGIELDKQRAITAHKRLDNVLNAEAIWGVRKANEWAGLLFLNPPYGKDADGDRLELNFVERFAPVVVKDGAMILVINPSSADEKTARALINNGFQVIASIYDPNNKDYKSFNQFFVILKRIDKKFRADLRDFQNVAWNPKPIDECALTTIDEGTIEALSVPAGKAPSLFKEIEFPSWKLDDLILKSRLHKRFNALMSSAQGANASIESPNDGQAALLVASGALGSKSIAGWLLKGQVIKAQKESCETDPETGEVSAYKVRDEYKTVLYGFNPKTLQFARFE